MQPGNLLRGQRRACGFVAYQAREVAEFKAGFAHHGRRADPCGHRRMSARIGRRFRFVLSGAPSVRRPGRTDRVLPQRRNGGKGRVFSVKRRVQRLQRLGVKPHPHFPLVPPAPEFQKQDARRRDVIGGIAFGLPVDAQQAAHIGDICVVSHEHHKGGRVEALVIMHARQGGSHFREQGRAARPGHQGRAVDHVENTAVHGQHLAQCLAVHLPPTGVAAGPLPILQQEDFGQAGGDAQASGKAHATALRRDAHGVGEIGKTALRRQAETAAQLGRRRRAQLVDEGQRTGEILL